MNAYTDALNALARRAMTVAECRARLLEREHAADDVEQAIARLLDTGALDDGRYARAFARTAVDVKGRGRLRVLQELQARGIPRGLAAEAVGEVFGEKDERSLVGRAIDKKLRGRPRTNVPITMAERGRLYQHLIRQGFTPAVILAELRKRQRAPTGDEGDDDAVQ